MLEQTALTASVALVVAMVISILLDFFPGLNTWWETAFNAKQKLIINALLVLLGSVGVLAYQCYFSSTPVCPVWETALLQLAMAFLVAGTGQQAIRNTWTKNPSL